MLCSDPLPSQAEPISQARALYEYTRQTEEELSFPDGVMLDVYDSSEPDWTLVGLNGEFGFVPSNYIDLVAIGDENNPVLDMPRTRSSSGHHEIKETEYLSPSTAQPATTTSDPVNSSSSPSKHVEPITSLPNRQDHSLETDTWSQANPPQSLPVHEQIMMDDDISSSRLESDNKEQIMSRYSHADGTTNTGHTNISAESTIQASPSADHMRVQGGFHLYNINEMVSLLGKKKKMPSTLGINIATRTILIAPERVSDGQPQEWSAEKMTHHSREGKHVFLELIRPSRSIDFHAGAKDTAEEIVSALEELAGIIRAEGLRDAILTSESRARTGLVLYDFVAQGDDEVTVGVGDQVVILDDRKSSEWWHVRRVKTGTEGVVPSSYIEIAGLDPSVTTTSKVRPSNDKKQALGQKQELADSSKERATSSHFPKNPRSKPDPARLRCWTDSSNSFSVEAQFLGLKDGKINLHKSNGVKIAVPLAKMSVGDLEYISKLTGIPASTNAHAATLKTEPAISGLASDGDVKVSSKVVGISLPNPKTDYDWFQFFLSCEIAVGLCDRYAQAFIRDSMDESVLSDVDSSVLRTLGLREGDIIKVMRALDAKFGRIAKRETGPMTAETSDTTNTTGLFSGPGGALRNNTRKGRPLPDDHNTPLAASLGSDTDSTAIVRQDSDSVSVGQAEPKKNALSCFEDDAWDLKPTQTQIILPTRPDISSLTHDETRKTDRDIISESLHDLSSLSHTLEPIKIERPLPPPDQHQSSAARISPAGINSLSQATAGEPSVSRGVSISQHQPTQQGSIISTSLTPLSPQRPLSAPHSVLNNIYAPPSVTAHMTGHTGANIAPLGQSLHDLSQMRYNQSLLQQPPAFAMPPSHVTNLPIHQIHSSSHGLTSMQDLSRPVPSYPATASTLTQTYSYPLQSFPQLFKPNGVNSNLPAPLEPDRTGVSTALYGNSVGFQNPQSHILQPQRTGPPPDVKFGLGPDYRKITPQSTGRRANLSQASMFERTIC
jgi:hypothetical protein